MPAERPPPLVVDDFDSPSPRPSKLPKKKVTTRSDSTKAKPKPKLAPVAEESNPPLSDVPGEKPMGKASSKTAKATAKPAKEKNAIAKASKVKAKPVEKDAPSAAELVKSNKKLEKRKEELEKQCKELKKTQKNMEKDKEVQTKRTQELQKEIEGLRQAIEEHDLWSKVPLNIQKAFIARSEETQALYESLLKSAKAPRPKGKSVLDFAVTHATLLPKIENLGTMQGGTTMAFEVLVLMMSNFHTADPNATSKVDLIKGLEVLAAMDDAMFGYAKLRWENPEEQKLWEPSLKALVKRLLERADAMEKVADVGVDNFFPSTLDFLEDISSMANDGDGEEEDEEGDGEDDDGVQADQEDEDSESESEVDETLRGL